MQEHTAHFKLMALLPSFLIACGSPDTTEYDSGEIDTREPATLVQRSEPVLGGLGFPDGIASDPSLQLVVTLSVHDPGRRSQVACVSGSE